MPTCFFIGHREAPETLMGELTAEVERLIIEYGVTDFVVGRYGRFDTLAAKCVKAAKKRRPEVTLTLLLRNPQCKTVATLHPPLVLGIPPCNAAL